MTQRANTMLLLAGLALAGLALVGGSVAPRNLLAESLPNIVLMMADDLGWGDLHCMGNGQIHTPQLDAMAAAGLKFNRFYAAAPVCSPTRGSCLTGRHPYRYGVFFANTGHLTTEEQTLAELLQKRGYATGHFGKWHLGTLTQTEKDANRGGPKYAQHFSPPWTNGFETCFSTESKTPTWDPMLKPKTVGGRAWWEPVVNAADALAYGTAYWTNGRRIEQNLRGDDSRIIMDRALPFIESAVAKGRPFFAVIWFHAPHLPVVAGRQYTQRYGRFNKHKQHYFGCITALDEQVGRLRRELRHLGVAQNTLLAFCSDNGPEGDAKSPGSTGGLRGRKRSLFEGGVRVPGIIEWPSHAPAGQTTDFPASTNDYLPTIVEIAGAERIAERPLDGLSLRPLFQGRLLRGRPSQHPAKLRARPIPFESSNQLALIDNRWKIISVGKRKAKPPTDLAAFMLFDLSADPGEQHDLSATHPGVVSRLREELLAWRRSCRRSLNDENF